VNAGNRFFDRRPLGAEAATGPELDELDVASYLQQWLAHARGRVRAVTYEGYEVLLRRHALPRIGHLRLHELHTLDIQNLYSELPRRHRRGPMPRRRQRLEPAPHLDARLRAGGALAAAPRKPGRGSAAAPRRPPRLLVDPPLLSRLFAIPTLGSYQPPR
jgi:Phage integrase, N-terminal SAM-like domain